MKKPLLIIFVICFFVIFLALSPEVITHAQGPSVNLQIVSTNSDAYPKVVTNFSVFDPQGFPIKELQKDQFTASEDNQVISNFTLTPFVNVDTPLAVVLVIDTSWSMNTSLANSIQAAKDFSKTLGPNDQVALIAFKEKPVVVQDFTTDRDELTKSLNSLTAVGDSGLYDSVVEAINILKPRTERKVVVLLTDGYETGISAFNFDEMVNEAARWSTPIYPVGFGGARRDNLEKLAKLTGGFAQFNPDSSALTEALNNVLINLRNQYSLEYVSSLMADGSEHEVAITYKYAEGDVSDTNRFIAQPVAIQVSFGDLQDGQEVSGDVLFAPNILASSTVKQMDIQVDDQPVTSILAAPFEYIWDSAIVQTGVHNLAFIITDSVGNTINQGLKLNVVPPVSITSNLTADQVISGTVKIPLEVTAARAIEKVEFFVDGVKISEDLDGPYEIEWDTKSTAPGYHDLRFVGTDIEQNIGEIQQRVNVEIQNSNNLLWLVLIVLLIAIGVIIPIATRKNRSTKKTTNQGTPFPSAINGFATLVEKEGFEPGHVWRLKGDEIRLGRKRGENDIVLKGASASRFQAVINLTPNGYAIKSVNPENPVLVNRQPITEQLYLKSGDVITAGESEFLFDASGI